MRRARHLVLLAALAVGLLGVTAGNSWAYPTSTAKCDTCHSGSGVTVTASVAAIGATSTTYNIGVTGGSAWAAFDGTTKLAGDATAAGTVTVDRGPKTYNVFGVMGPLTTNGLGAITLTPGDVTDTTAAITTSDIQDSYTGDATINLTATDNAGGWGVNYIYYKLDGGYTHLFQVTGAATTSLVVPAPATGSGLSAAHKLTFWSQDWAGNVEAHNAKSFTVVAAKTVTALTLARSASSVKANSYFTLSGAISPAAVQSVTVQYLKPGTHTWKTLVVRSTSAAGAYSYKYRTTVKGTWSFKSVYSGSATTVASTSSIVTVRIK